MALCGIYLHMEVIALPFVVETYFIDSNLSFSSSLAL